jgi:hypothetical protein
VSSAEGGFAGAQAGLGAVRQQTQWVNQQVGAGKLALNPEAAEAAAKHCEAEIEALGNLYRDSYILGRLTGLGDYPSGKELKQRFVDKATDKDAGALHLIRQMQEELQNQADAFRAAAKDYRATDEEIAHGFQRGTQ